MIKKIIRKKILKLRKKKYNPNFFIDPKKILKLLIKEEIKGKLIGGYYPYNFEINTMEIFETLQKKNYKISLPVIDKNKKMNFFKWDIKDPLLVNTYGIPEPIKKKKVYPNILIVPLLAFDSNLNRLGYGGGFYDRYIAKVKKKKELITIGLGYSFQKISKLPYNKHDVKLNFIITENKIYK